MPLLAKHAIVVSAALVCAAQPQAVFRSDVELVTIPCTVVDEQGSAVNNLTRADFRVFDNGIPRILEHLWDDRDAPVNLGVLIDESDSQQSLAAEHRKTVLALLDRILRPGDRVFVLTVAEEIRLAADWSASAAELRRRMVEGRGAMLGEPCPLRRSTAFELRPVSACGASPLWDAIYNAAALRLSGIRGNKALLILTDGFDTGSRHAWRQAVDEAQKAEASVYAIAYRSGSDAGYAPDLQRLAAEAGGTCFAPPEGDYTSILTRLETDLRHRYVLGFRPEQLSGRTRHEVRVETNRPDLTVRARKEYFR